MIDLTGCAEQTVNIQLAFKGNISADQIMIEPLLDGQLKSVNFYLVMEDLDI